MSAKGKADQAEVMALIRDFHKIERRMKGLDPADSASIKEARQMKGELARTLQRRRGMLEATLERGYTTAADRRVGEEIARLLYSWDEEDSGPETAGGKPPSIGRSGCRPNPVPVLVRGSWSKGTSTPSRTSPAVGDRAARVVRHGCAHFVAIRPLNLQPPRRARSRTGWRDAVGRRSNSPGEP